MKSAKHRTCHDFSSVMEKRSDSLPKARIAFRVHQAFPTRNPTTRPPRRAGGLEGVRKSFF